MTILIKQFQQIFAAGKVKDLIRDTQIAAVWREWACEESDLAPRAARLGKVIAKFRAGGKVNPELDKLCLRNLYRIGGWYYDQIWIGDPDGETKLIISFREPDMDQQWVVYSPSNNLKEPVARFNSDEDLIAWINPKWPMSSLH